MDAVFAQIKARREENALIGSNKYESSKVMDFKESKVGVKNVRDDRLRRLSLLKKRLGASQRIEKDSEYETKEGYEHEEKEEKEEKKQPSLLKYSSKKLSFREPPPLPPPPPELGDPVPPPPPVEDDVIPPPPPPLDMDEMSISPPSDWSDIFPPPPGMELFTDSSISTSNSSLQPAPRLHPEQTIPSPPVLPESPLWKTSSLTITTSTTKKENQIETIIKPPPPTAEESEKKIQNMSGTSGHYYTKEDFDKILSELNNMKNMMQNLQESGEKNMNQLNKTNTDMEKKLSKTEEKLLKSQQNIEKEIANRNNLKAKLEEERATSLKLREELTMLSSQLETFQEKEGSLNERVSTLEMELKQARADCRKVVSIVSKVVGGREKLYQLIKEGELSLTTEQEESEEKKVQPEEHQNLATEKETKAVDESLRTSENDTVKAKTTTTTTTTEFMLKKVDNSSYLKSKRDIQSALPPNETVSTAYNQLDSSQLEYSRLIEARVRRLRSAYDQTKQKERFNANQIETKGLAYTPP